MNKSTWPRILNLIVAIVTIVFNILANALPLNGQNTGEISDRFKVYFVPAAYVFAIWGVIYVGWLAFAIYQLLPSQRNNTRLDKAGPLFALSGLANMAWLFCWHYNYLALSVVVMLVLLVSLIALYLRLQIGQVKVSTAERWCVDIPFSIYLGWITVATIANVTALLYGIKWSGWGLSDITWTLIMLAAGVIIAAAMQATRRDAAYLLVLIWAFAGIAIKHAGVAPVATGAWVATALVALILLAGNFLLRSRRDDLAPAR